MTGAQFDQARAALLQPTARMRWVPWILDRDDSLPEVRVGIHSAKLQQWWQYGGEGEWRDVPLEWHPERASGVSRP